MQISKTLMGALHRLMAGESVAASSLRKDIAETLLAEGLLTVKTKGSRRTYRTINTSALKVFLESHYEELRGFENSEVLRERSNITRSEQAAETGNSKLVKLRSCPGFPVNTYEPIVCSLHGRELVVNPIEGSFMFIIDWEDFVVPEDVIVVGVENMENFRMIRHQREFFESEIGSQRLLFVSRYPQSTDLRSWLQNIPNRYIHFGDFDLAGIHIFLTEFHKCLGERSSFFIPSDIEQRLEYGSTIRYDAQYSKFHTLKCDVQNLQLLIDLINKYHRCYDQEGYIF
jgi:hypothetical protein